MPSRVDVTVLDVQFMKLPGWIIAASYFFTASHTVEYPMARSDQNSIRVAGGVPSLIRNAVAKEVWRHNTVRDLLIDVQFMLDQTVCAAYIMCKL
eukprot:1159242-Pelagomonas_calceolata.AAC.2